LTVTTRLDAQCGLAPYGKVVDRNEVGAARLWAVNSEELDLPLIVTTKLSRIAVMGVATADGKANGSQSQSSGLALNARKAHAVIDYEVAPCVLTERTEDVKAGILESEHDRQLRPVTDRLRMIH
jgi:hypothetical protein